MVKLVKSLVGQLGNVMKLKNFLTYYLAGTMTQLFGVGETECSVILFYTYALASVSLTLWSTLFMWLVG